MSRTSQGLSLQFVAVATLVFAVAGAVLTGLAGGRVLAADNDGKVIECELLGGVEDVGGVGAEDLVAEGEDDEARLEGVEVEGDEHVVLAVAGDLGDERAIREGMADCDAVIHAAAVYEVGIPVSERAAMREANVGGTERVLGAALEAKIPAKIRELLVEAIETSSAVSGTSRACTDMMSAVRHSSSRLTCFTPSALITSGGVINS